MDTDLELFSETGSAESEDDCEHGGRTHARVLLGSSMGPQVSSSGKLRREESPAVPQMVSARDPCTFVQCYNRRDRLRSTKRPGALSGQKCPWGSGVS